MREQLEYLVETSMHPNISLHVVPAVESARIPDFWERSPSLTSRREYRGLFTWKIPIRDSPAGRRA